MWRRTSVPPAREPVPERVGSYDDLLSLLVTDAQAMRGHLAELAVSDQQQVHAVAAEAHEGRLAAVRRFAELEQAITRSAHAAVAQPATPATDDAPTEEFDAPLPVPVAWTEPPPARRWCALDAPTVALDVFRPPAPPPATGPPSDQLEGQDAPPAPPVPSVSPDPEPPVDARTMRRRYRARARELGIKQHGKSDAELRAEVDARAAATTPSSTEESA